MPRTQVKWNDKWLDEIDGNGDVVKEWLKRGSDASVICKWCSGKTFLVKSGLTNILSHSQCEAHKKVSSSRKTTKSITNVFTATSSAPSSSKTDCHKEAEIRWIIRLIISNWSFESQTGVVEDFLQMFPDSNVPSKMQLGPDKISYIINEAIAPHIKQHISKEISAVDAYSIHIDEVNKNYGYMGLVLRYLPKDSWNVKTVCCDLPVLTSGNAKSITEAISSSLIKLNIPKRTCVAVMSDSCRTMRGNCNIHSL